MSKGGVTIKGIIVFLLVIIVVILLNIQSHVSGDTLRFHLNISADDLINTFNSAALVIKRVHLSWVFNFLAWAPLLVAPGIIAILMLRRLNIAKATESKKILNDKMKKWMNYH